MLKLLIIHQGYKYETQAAFCNIMHCFTFTRRMKIARNKIFWYLIIIHLLAFVLRE